MNDFTPKTNRITKLMDDIENGYNKQLKEFYDDLKKIEAQMKNNWTLQQHYAELFLKVQSTPTAFEKFFDTENRDEKKLRSVMQERRDIDEIEQIYAHDSDKRDAAIMYREEQGREERASIEDGWVLDSFGHVSDEFTKGLAKSLTDFGNFKENIKAMADEMAEYLIQRALEAFIKIAMESKYMKAALSTGQSLLKTGTGFLGSVGKAVVNFFNPSKHHSGGVILPGANERIRVGAVGVHSRGSALAKNFAKISGCEVTNICDVDSRSLAKCAAAVEKIQNNKVKREKDVRKMLESNPAFLSEIEEKVRAMSSEAMLSVEQEFVVDDGDDFDLRLSDDGEDA